MAVCVRSKLLKSCWEYFIRFHSLCSAGNIGFCLRFIELPEWLMRQHFRKNQILIKVRCNKRLACVIQLEETNCGVLHITEVLFASFLSGGFTTLAVINPPERKLAIRTSVCWIVDSFYSFIIRKKESFSQLKLGSFEFLEASDCTMKCLPVCFFLIFQVKGFTKLLFLIW